jgi:hypothetical protein
MILLSYQANKGKRIMSRKITRRIHICKCKDCQLHPYGQIAKRHQAINRVLADLNERNRRRFTGVLANQQGRGGTSHLAEITGLSRTTIARGRCEIERSSKNRSFKIRQSGAGRLRVEKNSQKY